MSAAISVRRRPTGSLATISKDAVPAGAIAGRGDPLDPGEGRRVPLKRAQELGHRRRRALDLGEHPVDVVADQPGEAEPGRQRVHEGPEADSLDDALHPDGRPDRATLSPGRRGHGRRQPRRRDRAGAHGSWAVRSQALTFGMVTSNSTVTSFLSLSVPKKPEYGVMPKSVCRIVALPRNWPGAGLMTCSRSGREVPRRVSVPSIAPLAGATASRGRRDDPGGGEAGRGRVAEDLARLALDVPAVPVGERLGAARALADRQRAEVKLGGQRRRGDAAAVGAGDRDPRRPPGDLQRQVVARPGGQSLAPGLDQHPAGARAELVCSRDVSHGTTVRTDLEQGLASRPGAARPAR